MEFGAAHLFDLSVGSSIYRVFLLPGCLQFDLSFTPASKFGATGPNFKILFGISVEKPFPPPPSAQELFGYAVHHALRARFSIERGHYWHAEYWISGTRDFALSLACRRRRLSASHGRGFDDLPNEVRDVFIRRWWLHWSGINCFAPSAVLSRGCWAKRMRFKSWRKESNHNYRC